MPNSLIQTFEKAGQGQVFRFFKGLEPQQQEHLLEQARQIDLDELKSLVATLVQKPNHSGIDLSDLEPAPYFARPENGGDMEAWESAFQAGEDALRAGRVAAFTVAGGQGTRLGYEGPKGTFPVTPIRRATLFQIFAEKILAARERYQASIPWFIMTSRLNHETTVQFFKAHAYFGMDEGSISFFRQGLMPAVDAQGNIILESHSSIAMTPDGHGGSLRALVRHGATQQMAAMGIDVISYFQVDNPLVTCIDPAFIGFHLREQSEMSSKMVLKAYPKEKLGHFCKQRGKLVVIEYSDLPNELCEQREPSGALTYRTGSIAVHLFSRTFVERMGSGHGLPFHRADKKITTLDEAGKPYSTEVSNGMKFEQFVFDALPFAQHPIIIESNREHDFSPVKNAKGIDSPQSCHEAQLRLFASWLNAAGEPIEQNTEGLPRIQLEVSPLFADTQSHFIKKWTALPDKPTLKNGLVIE